MKKEICRLLEKAGVQVFQNSPVFEVKEDGVIINIEGEIRFIPAETVVLAAGLKPETSLATELKGIVPRVYAIGDCVKPRKAVDAIYEGLKIGREI